MVTAILEVDVDLPSSLDSPLQRSAATEPFSEEMVDLEFLTLNGLNLNGLYLEAKRSLDILRADVGEYAAYLKPRHPKIISLRDEIERKQRRLSIYRSQLIEGIEKEKSSLRMQLKNLDLVVA